MPFYFIAIELTLKASTMNDKREISNQKYKVVYGAGFLRRRQQELRVNILTNIQMLFLCLKE